MSLHITVTNEDGKTVIDDDTTMLALVWVVNDGGKRCHCGGAVLGEGNAAHHVALVNAMDNIRARIMSGYPGLAKRLALQAAFGAWPTEIDMSELARTALGHPSKGGGSR